MGESWASALIILQGAGLQGIRSQFSSAPQEIFQCSKPFYYAEENVKCIGISFSAQDCALVPVGVIATN